MRRIYIYTGNVDELDLSSVKAMISFVSESAVKGISTVKTFSSDEARKGLEQLKRWVSTGSFKVVVLEGFVEALEKGNTSHILEWIEDHSSEPDFPTLILLGDSSAGSISGLATPLMTIEDVVKVINT